MWPLFPASKGLFQMTSPLSVRLLDAAVASMKNFVAKDPAAAFCLGPSIYNYALLPMIGQYLSLAQNHARATILPEFKPLFDELGAERFTKDLLCDIQDAQSLVSRRFETAEADLGGPLQRLELRALSTGSVEVTLCSQYASSSSIGPRPSVEQSFFPRAFCAALATEVLDCYRDLPSYICFEGDLSAWRQCLSASTA
jgi:hypothetical protein